MPTVTFADTTSPGYARIRRGSGFSVLSPKGKAIRDERVLKRVASLVIPPAWNAVWIAPSSACHIQATGLDARGRRQYIYHPDFRAAREAEKFSRLARFAAQLPAIRRQVADDMARRGLPREKVVATVVHLLDRTLIRIGNRAYAEQNSSFGLSTLRRRHAETGSSDVRFAFRGKSGQEWRVRVQDRRVAKVIRACQGLPGQHLFKYLDADGQHRAISSDDVNAYLRAVAGNQVSAKDFRTWAGTVLSGVALSLAPPADAAAKRRRQVASAIRAVAHRLGNTPAVCRSAYVHPAVFAAFDEGLLHRHAERLRHGDDGAAGHSPAEVYVLMLVRRRKRRPGQKPGVASATASP